MLEQLHRGVHTTPLIRKEVQQSKQPQKPLLKNITSTPTPFSSGSIVSLLMTKPGLFSVYKSLRKRLKIVFGM